LLIAADADDSDAAAEDADDDDADALDGAEYPSRRALTPPLIADEGGGEERKWVGFA